MTPYFKMFLVACALLGAVAFCAEKVAASPLPSTVGVHVATWHEKDGMNNVNPGIYGRWDNGFTMGAYYNSERRSTFYMGWTFSDASDTLALTIGGATGYERANIVPLVIPSVRIPISQNFALRIGAAPLKENAAIHLSLEGRF